MDGDFLDERWVEAPELEANAGIGLSRRMFIAGGISLPSATVLLPKIAHSAQGIRDKDLRFLLSGDRQVLTVQIIIEPSVGGSSEPSSRSILLDESAWTLPARRFGPNAKFTLFRRQESSRLRYRLRVSGCRFGRNAGRTIDFDFTLDRRSDQARWSISASTDFWRHGDEPWEDAGPTQFPEVDLRKFIWNEVALNQESVAYPFVRGVLDRVFNRAVTINAKSWIAVSLSADGYWHLKRSNNPTTDEKEKPLLSAIHGDIGLNEFDFGWTFDDESGPEEEEARAQSAESVTGVVGKGRPYFTAEALRLHTGATEFELAAESFGNLVARVIEPDLRGAETEARRSRRLPHIAQAALEANWTCRFLDDGELTGPFSGLRGVLVREIEVSGDEAHRELPNSGARNSVTFRALFSTAADQHIASPAGQLRIAGITSETPGPGERGTPPDREADPFRERPEPTVRARFTSSRNGLPEEMAFEQIEATVLLSEASLAPENTEFSRLLFDGSDLVFLFTPKVLPSLPGRSFVLLNREARGAVIAQIDLSRASLKASRSADLAALTFRFLNLLLDVRSDGVRILSYTGRCGIWRTAPIDRVGRTYSANGADKANGAGEVEETPRQSEIDDTRPILVVEFPPQHVMEEALFRPQPPALPDSRGEGDIDSNGTIKFPYLRGKWESEEEGAGQWEEVWRSADGPSAFDPEYFELNIAERDAVLFVLGRLPAVRRLSLREKIKEIKTKASTEFKNFAEAMATSEWTPRGGGRRIPAEQRVYIGPYSMDPDTAVLARDVQQKLHDSLVRERVFQTFENIYAIATELLGKKSDGKVTWPPASDLNAKRALEAVMEGAVPSYQEFRAFYREHVLDTNPTDGKLIDFFADDPGGNSPKKMADDYLMRPIVKDEYLVWLKGVDKPAGLTEARLSRRSRLAFRINCADVVASTRPAERGDDETGGGRPDFRFDFEHLTNWSGMDLSVVRRAENNYLPGYGGRLDAGGGRRIGLSASAMLDNLGFTSGRMVNAATRAADVQRSLQAPPGAFETEIVLPARLSLSTSDRAVFLTPRRPPPEIFFRRSDGQDGFGDGGSPSRERLWTATLLCDGNDPGLRAVHSPDLRADFVWGGQMNRDWQAQWPEPPQSDSDKSDVAKQADGGYDAWARLPGGGAPPGEGLAPWMIGPEETNALHPPANVIARRLKLAEQENDEFCKKVLEKYASEPGKGKFPRLLRYLCARDKDLESPPYRPLRSFRTSLSANDRHQLVLLSSAWGIPVTGRRTLAGTLTADSSQLEPEERYALADLEPGNAIYNPRTLQVSELSLTALGGSFRHDTSFQPFASARHISGRNLFDAVSIQQWQHWIVLGRDVSCEVLYRGFLAPTMHLAALCKLTDRTFIRDPNTRLVRAYLRQRLFIRCSQPKKSFPAFGQPNSGRRFPARRVEMLTRVTADIVDPYDGAPPTLDSVSAGGRIGLRRRVGLVFWPRTERRDGAEVRFQLSIDGIKSDLPMVFVDNVAVNDDSTMAALKEYYGGLASPDKKGDVVDFDPKRHKRTIALFGEKVRYCPEIKSGSASIETESWTLSLEGRERLPPVAVVEGRDRPSEYRLDNANFVFSPQLQGADQPPLYPYVETCRIRLRQSERFTGKKYRPARAKVDGHFAIHGLAGKSGPPEPPDDQPPSALTAVRRAAQGAAAAENTSEIYLNLLDQKPLDMGTKGDQSGGVYRPGGYIVALSRSKGVVTHQKGFGDINHASVTAFSPIYSGPEKAADVGKSQETFRRNTPLENRRMGADERQRALAGRSIDDRWREIYQSYFSSDATLLGVIPMSDVFKFLRGKLEDPRTGAPQLIERVRYGIHRAEQGTNEALEDTTSFVREEVARPLSRAVKSIRRDWERLDREMQARQPDLGRLVKAVTLAEVFPELDSGLKDLDAALESALSENDEVLFAFALSEVYEAGRRFLDAIIETAANPGEGIGRALRTRFDAVTEYGGALLGGIGKLFDDLKNDISLPDENAIATWVGKFLVPGNDHEAWPYLPLPYPNFKSEIEPDYTLPLRRSQVRGAATEIARQVAAGETPNLQSVAKGLQKDAIGRAERLWKKLHDDGVPPPDEDVRRLRCYLAFLNADPELVSEVLFETFRSELSLAQEVVDAYTALVKSSSGVQDAVRVAVGLVDRVAGPLDFDFGALCQEKGVPSFLASYGEMISVERLLLCKAGFQTSSPPGRCPETGNPLPDGFQPGSTGDPLCKALWDFHQGARSISQKLGEAREKFTVLDVGDVEPGIREKVESVFAESAMLALALTERSGRIYSNLYNDSMSLRALDVALSQALTALKKCLAGPEAIEETIQAVAAISKILTGVARARQDMASRTLEELKGTLLQIGAFIGDEDVQAALAAAALADLIKDAWMANNARVQAAKIAVAELDQAVREAAGHSTDFLGELSGGIVAVLNSLADQLESMSEAVKYAGFELTVKGLKDDVASIRETARVLTSVKEALHNPSGPPARAFRTLKEMTVDVDGAAVPVFDLLSWRPDRQNAGVGRWLSIEKHLKVVTADLGEISRRWFADVKAGVLSTLDDYARKMISTSFKIPGDDDAPEGGRTLPDAYRWLVETRDYLEGEINKSPIAGTPFGARLLAALSVDPREGEEGERLGFDGAWLGKLSGSNEWTGEERRFLVIFLKEWGFQGGRKPTPALIVEQLAEVVTELVRGDLLQLIPLEQIREQIEQYLLSLVPTRIEMSHGFGVTLDGSVADATGGIFEPEDGCQLRVDMAASIDMSAGTPEFRMRSVGTLGRFRINLVGTFDAVTLIFNGVSFISENGGTPSINVDYDDYEVGEQLKFLDDLKNYISPKGRSGFYLTETRNNPGIEAGYSLNLGIISVGNASFFNVSFNAAVILPFNRGRALFKSSLSRRDAPFTVSYAPFGGSGFFALTASGRGIESVELSLEFGAAGAFGAGPLSGQGRIMAGFYIRVETVTAQVNGKTVTTKVTEILGTFYAGGSASIWIFSFSASLSVRLGQVGGQMKGEAQYTFAFSVGIKDFEYTVGFVHEEGQNLSSPQSAKASLKKSLFSELRLMAEGSETGVTKKPIQFDVSPPENDWYEYRRYFDTNIPLERVF